MDSFPSLLMPYALRQDATNELERSGHPIPVHPALTLGRQHDVDDCSADPRHLATAAATLTSASTLTWAMSTRAVRRGSSGSSRS